MAITHILYLHGFRSSPQSAKARQLAAYIAQHYPSVTFWCPQLPPSPKAAMALVTEGISRWPADKIAVVGSSLGGFYASWVAQQVKCPSVMLNPGINPARDLAPYVGEQTAWHNPSERFQFRPEYITEMKEFDVQGQLPAGPELAIIAEGDEVIDWHEMVDRYPHAKQIVLKGGDHALEDFGDYLAEVSKFLVLQ